MATDTPGNATTSAVAVIVSSAGKPGDINSDNSVNIFDLSLLPSIYKPQPACASNPQLTCDATGGGKVNVFDLISLLGHHDS